MPYLIYELFLLFTAAAHFRAHCGRAQISKLAYRAATSPHCWLQRARACVHTGGVYQIEHAANSAQRAESETCARCEIGFAPL
jgi:hypothetical protein